MRDVKRTAGIIAGEKFHLSVCRSLAAILLGGALVASLSLPTESYSRRPPMYISRLVIKPLRFSVAISSLRRPIWPIIYCIVGSLGMVYETILTAVYNGVLPE